MKNELFVTTGEVVQELSISKPFAYKLVRQMNEKLLSENSDLKKEQKKLQQETLILPESSILLRIPVPNKQDS